MNNMTNLGARLYPNASKNSHQNEDGEFLNNPNYRFLSTIKNLADLQSIIRNNIIMNSNNRVDRSFLASINLANFWDIDLKSLNELTLDYYKTNTTSFTWWIDSIVVLWALVVIYDSSQSLPRYFSSNNRWECKTIFYNWKYISVIWIDVNKDSREKDKVTPQISLHHELQHHLNVTLWDQIIAQNDFWEAIRNNDPPRWFRSKSEWVAWREDLIWKFFWRNVDLKSIHPSIKSVDYEIYEEQLYYLDELSASFWQQKSSVFWPKQLFYNNVNPKNRTHYEIIWKNTEDINNLKKLFTDFIMPWLYLFELIKNYEWLIFQLEKNQQNDTINKSINDAKIKNYKDYVKNIRYCIYLITQTLGLSRTINQAVTLLSEIWRSEISIILNNNDLSFLDKSSKWLHIYL